MDFVNAAAICICASTCSNMGGCLILLECCCAAGGASPGTRVTFVLIDVHLLQGTCCTDTRTCANQYCGSFDLHCLFSQSVDARPSPFCHQLLGSFPPVPPLPVCADWQPLPPMSWRQRPDLAPECVLTCSFVGCESGCQSKRLLPNCCSKLR